MKTMTELEGHRNRMGKAIASLHGYTRDAQINSSNIHHEMIEEC